MRVELRIAPASNSASKPASCMRAIGRHDLDVRALLHVRHRVASRRLRHDCRKLQREPATFIELALDADAAAVLFQNFLTYREAQTGSAAALARDKHRKDLFQIV